MTDSLSITNILQALYEESPTIKMYVDCIAEGKPVPYTLITKSTEHEKNEQIVERIKKWRNELKDYDDYLHGEELVEKLDEVLDEAMVLEEEKYEVVMIKDDAVVEGSRQIVKGTKVQQLKNYAQFKGYIISVRKLE